MIDPEVRERIRMEYITRNTPLHVLATKNGVDREELNRIAEDEGWAEQRDEFWRGFYSDVLHATKSATAQLLGRTVTTAEKLVRWANDKIVVTDDGVIISPDEIASITQAIRVGLDVLRFTLGEPESLTITASRVEPETQKHVLDEAADRLKELVLQEEFDEV